MSDKETVLSVKEKYGTAAQDRLQPKLEASGFDSIPPEIALVALKEERLLELWGQRNGQWVKIKQYPFTQFSGQLGPKLREGDKQIPEGVYTIAYLNPNSSYHLSLKVDYPNAFDRAKAQAEGRRNLGGDIFIHGKAVTIGCIPIGDRAIEEVFLVASHALDNTIKVIISPVDFRLGKAFPEIEAVEWEKELYEDIQLALEAFST